MISYIFYFFMFTGLSKPFSLICTRQFYLKVISHLIQKRQSDNLVNLISAGTYHREYLLSHSYDATHTAFNVTH